MKTFTLFLIVILNAALAWSSVYAPVNDAELEQFRTMLRAGGLMESDPAFEKDWDLSTRFKSKHQMQMLSDPWQAFSAIADLREYLAPDSTLNGLATRMEFLSRIAFDIGPDKVTVDFQYDYDALSVLFKRNVRKPKQLFAYMQQVFQEAEKHLQKAFSELSPAQVDSLGSFFFTAWTEEDDKDKLSAFLKRRKYPSADDFEISSMADLLEKIDFIALMRAWQIHQAGSLVLLDNIHTLSFKNKKPFYKETPWGLMVIGGTGNDSYPQPKIRKYAKRICFLYEPGGDDVYNIDIYADRHQPFYLMIDANGNDQYRNPGMANFLFSAFGIGASYDLDGDDSYSADDFSCSAFCGYQTHLDNKGSDSYRSGLFTQGAAMFGVSVLLDNSGSDIYSATSFAQGVGGTRGLGALLDHNGHDVYYIGGKYLHKPLMPFDFRSMGQGMGFGFRPDLAGGLGLLYDAGGNDKYIGGVYAQGVGYWYASGLLIDEKGNDVYNAIYYPQGSGIHLACGFLFDGEGDDSYYTRNGPGQGAGHDWSLGILIDRSGNDHYSIPGGNGLGLTNSVGIFLDSGGDDRYERRDASSIGFANMARGTGGIGLFLDAGGKDSYPDLPKESDGDEPASAPANDSFWQRGSFGLGQDLELNIITESKTETLAEMESADLDSLMAIDELFAIAAEWEVGSAVEKVRKAREIMLSREEEASSYVIENKLNTKSGLEYRALEALISKSPRFKTALFNELASTDTLKAKNALALIAGTGDSTLITYIGDFLQSRKYVAASLSALGGLKTDPSIDLLIPFTESSSERLRYISVRSLVGIGNPRAMDIIKGKKDDSSFLVRTMVREKLKGQ